MDTNKGYGYFMISRKLKESWLHPSVEERKFTKYEAWIWIIENARFVCSNPIMLNGKLLTIPRGYFSTTVNHLSKVFSWNERTTEKFLQLLETDGKIKRFKVNPKTLKSYTLIKVNKYNDYQPKVCDICNSEYKTKCNLNCCSNKKEPKEEKMKRFTKPTLEEVGAYCTARCNGINAQDFINFYESKGWKVGKSPMKDWKAAVRTWESKRKKAKNTEKLYEASADDFYMRLSR